MARQLAPPGDDTLGRAIVHEWHRTWRRPFETPLCVLLNATMVTVAWLVFDGQLRFALLGYRGHFALPLALLSWMVADVPATNVLASNAEVALEALGNHHRLLRMVVARHLVLWLVAVPPCIVVDLVIGVRTDHLFLAWWVAAVIAVVPATTLGLASWVGLVLPYRPVPWQRRLADLRVMPLRTARWATALVAPYVVVPALGEVVVEPIRRLVPPLNNGLAVRVSPTKEAVAGVVTLGLGLAVAWLGYRGMLWLSDRRATVLRADLSDVDWA